MAKYKIWLGGETPEQEAKIREYGNIAMSSDVKAKYMKDGHLLRDELCCAIRDGDDEVGIPNWDDFITGGFLNRGVDARDQYIGVMDVDTEKIVYLKKIHEVNPNQMCATLELNPVEPHDEHGWDLLQIFYKKMMSGTCVAELEFNHETQADYVNDFFRPGGLVISSSFILNEKYKIVTDVHYFDRRLEFKYDYITEKVKWYTILNNEQTHIM